MSIPARFVILAVGALAVPTAGIAAEEVELTVNPASLIDRPILLPKWTVQAEFAVGVGSQRSFQGGGPPVFSEQALSLGLPHHAQLGLYVRESFGDQQASTLMVNAQDALLSFLSVRGDLGFSQSEGASTPGLTFGLGIPFRLRFDEHVALISGTGLGRSFGSASADGDRATFTPSEDFVTLRQVQLPCALGGFRGPGPGVGGGGCGGGWWGTLGIPLGLLIQPRAGVAFALRTGIRTSFGLGVGPPTTSWPIIIPVGLDAVVSPLGKWLDLGLSGQIAGTPDALGSNRSITLWTNVRI